MKQLLTVLLLIAGVGCNSDVTLEKYFSHGFNKGYRLAADSVAYADSIAMDRFKDSLLNSALATISIPSPPPPLLPPADIGNDDKLLHRYSDSIGKYLNLACYLQENKEPGSEAAWEMNRYYIKLFNPIYERNKKPDPPIERPADMNIYPPKP